MNIHGDTHNSIRINAVNCQTGPFIKCRDESFKIINRKCNNNPMWNSSMREIYSRVNSHPIKLFKNLNLPPIAILVSAFQIFPSTASKGAFKNSPGNDRNNQFVFKIKTKKKEEKQKQAVLNPVKKIVKRLGQACRCIYLRDESIEAFYEQSVINQIKE